MSEQTVAIFAWSAKYHILWHKSDIATANGILTAIDAAIVISGSMIEFDEGRKRKQHFFSSSSRVY